MRHKVIQADLFDDQVVEVSYEGKRLILRCDPTTQRKERYRREDKIQRLKEQVRERNTFLEQSKRAQPKSGLTKLQEWSKRHKIASFLELKLKGRKIECLIDEEAKKEDELLDGCYCIESDVKEAHLNKDEVHDRYKDLQKVERDFLVVYPHKLKRVLFQENACSKYTRPELHLHIAPVRRKWYAENDTDTLEPTYYTLTDLI